MHSRTPRPHSFQGVKASGKQDEAWVLNRLIKQLTDMGFPVGDGPLVLLPPPPPRTAPAVSFHVGTCVQGPPLGAPAESSALSGKA